MTTQVNTLIARIESLATALKGPKDTKMVVVKLKEANGKSYEWSSFHVDAFKEFEVGDVIEIEPKLVFKDGNKWPFRNIEKVIGKREASQINTLDVLAQQPGKEPEAPGSQSSNGTYDQGKAIERRSIERQTSVKLMGEIYKAGCGVDDLQIIAEGIVKAAETVETWLGRQGAVAAIQSPSTPSSASESTNGAKAPNSTPDLDSFKMETIGDLFTAVKDRYKKTPADIFDALNVTNKEELAINMTIANAWGTLQSIWEGPPTKEQPEN